MSVEATKPQRRPYDYAKRAMDLIASLMALALLSPVMLVTALVVGVKLGRPVLFTQPRPGRYGRVFRLYKFRSMRSVDAARGLVSDEQRLTHFGRILRSSSLDELPSLWNVVRGDMSMVGPRPLLVEYLSLYTTRQARRHEVRPGVTGLAQVSGRNALSWEQKFALDVQYVERRSLIMDARIMMATLRSVITRDGISQAGHVTMIPFGGSDA